MKIQVLGSGCAACHQLFEMTKKAAKELNINDEVEYIDDIKKIIEMGVIQVPVLAIDGRPVLTGSVSDIKKIKSVLTGKNAGSEDSKPGCSCGGKC
ncbi:MAG: thioredoxin family protein [Candidatus Parcubacteria bacterium]|nr:thioredoxin family protein [Candidatus Parcubacteria bacterium]